MSSEKSTDDFGQIRYKKMHKFKELKVWQRGRHLVKDIYLHTNNFPKDEIYGITSQIRRSVVSIPTNIAEGCGRNSNAELCRSLDIANGSAFELETLLIVSCDLKILSDEVFLFLNSQLQEIQKDDL
ncbi:MAG TPA: four helix bundle protein [Prolixibacteraceae bacterium]|nr:four helix bundle protein [Prolixibacteraceae bacterium]